MADIRPLPSGKFCVRIRRKGHPTVTKTFNQKKDADRFARQIEADIDKGVFVDLSVAQQTTLGEALDRYLAEVSPLKKGGHIEAVRIAQWKKHSLAAKSLAALKPTDFAKYRDDRLNGEGRAANTVRLELAIISNLFTVARKEWGIPVDNHILKIRLPSPGKARNRRLEGDEYQRLVQAAKAAKSPLLAPLIILAVETGMRLGELLGLTWKDVDLQKRTAQLWDTKNGDSRPVPLTLLAAETLRLMPRHIREERIFYGWKDAQSLKQAWRFVTTRAKLEDFHFHDLRHEAVSRLFELGLNQFEVAKISGHKTMQMLSRYTHLSEDHVLTKLDQRISQKM